MDEDENIVLFDGYCHLCSSVVRFVIKNKSAKRIRFVPLQSSLAEVLLMNKPKLGIDSVVFYSKGQVYFKSTAVFKIAGFLQKPFFYFSYFSFLPVRFTDLLYDVIASIRYKLFGKRNTCFLPE